MTEKLYYQDSHRKEFEARVVSCEWNERYFFRRAADSMRIPV